MTAYKYISQLANNQRRLIDSMSAGKEYSGAQARVMHYLTQNKGKTIFQKEIEKIFGLRPSTATELLKTMESRGLIQRIQSKEDARYKKIVLTEKADGYKDALLDDMDQLESVITSGVDIEDYEVWLKVTKMMLENLERKQNEK